MLLGLRAERPHQTEPSRELAETGQPDVARDISWRGGVELANELGWALGHIAITAPPARHDTVSPLERHRDYVRSGWQPTINELLRPGRFAGRHEQLFLPLPSVREGTQ